MNALASLLAARPKRALVAVLLFVLVAGVFGGPVAGSLRDSGGFTAEDSNSARAIDRVEAATGLEAAPGVILVTDSADAPGVRADLAAVEGVAAVVTGPPSRDGTATYVAATLRADADEDAVIEGAEAIADRVDADLGGPVIADMQIGESVTGDLGRAELLAFPVLLLLSLVFFRGRAAVLPLVIGMTTVLGTFLVLSGVNQFYGLSIFALNLVIGLGLGLAIDYTLFLVTRFREELARTDDVSAAVRVTLETAGRTVVYSAVTVAVSLMTLTLFPLNFLQSMGIAGAVVVLVAGAASLVIAPALFALWGRKLLVKPRRAGKGNWYRLAHGVMRRPGLVAGVTALVMLVAAAPALRAEWSPVDSSVIPKGQSARTAADRLQDEFPGQDAEPVTVVVGAPRSEAAAVRGFADELGALPGAQAVAKPVSLDESTWSIAVTPAGDPAGEQARLVVTKARERGAPGEVLVAGAAADFVDQQDAIGSRLLPAAALLAVLIFGVLWLMTGSILLPLKAILMNVLTVAASLGALTLVFQDGRFADLLGYTPNGGVEPTDFLVAAALIFALSTDYGVFLLGRIKEARDGTISEREAVAVGLERTGAVVTAAAILLAVAIGAFITSSISFIQQIGVATAVGVLLDAFIVRALLVPSLMALLGKWNWWSPKPLARLHERIGLDEAPAVR
ncbi:MAG: MMPL family transporter [Solirubrobacteraceae bacterium]